MSNFFLSNLIIALNAIPAVIMLGALKSADAEAKAALDKSKSNETSSVGIGRQLYKET